MNYRVLLLTCMLGWAVVPQLKAQSANDVFDKNVNITWLGIDFSAALFIGDREKFGSTSDVKYLFEAWNDLMIKEAGKYDVAGMIKRKKVENAIEIAKAHNAEIDPATMFSNKSTDYIHIKPGDVQEIVNTYDFGKLSGIGLMFIVESFNKLNEEASIYVTFINLDTKEIIFTEKMNAVPGGFGIKNFWAGAVYKVIKRVGDKEFENWRKKYNR